MRRLLIPYLLVCAYVTNVAWSPRRSATSTRSWVQSNARQAQPRPRRRRSSPTTPRSRRPTGCCRTWRTASRSTTGRTRSSPPYWGNDDTYRLPDPSTIEYLVIDRQQVGEAQRQLLADLIDGDPYRILFDQQDVVVARARRPADDPGRGRASLRRATIAAAPPLLPSPTTVKRVP